MPERQDAAYKAAFVYLYGASHRLDGEDDSWQIKYDLIGWVVVVISNHV